MAKLFLIPILACLIGAPAYAQEPAPEPVPAQAPQKPKEEEGLIVGKNIKVGMPLSQAIDLLGIPKKLKVQRGMGPELDSVSVHYEGEGVIIHNLNDKGTLEELELLPSFKGQFDKGLKLGDKIDRLIEVYGVPDMFSNKIAQYPGKGIYFFLKGDTLVSAKFFVKDSKILDHQLIRR
ncbi:MAG: hypothetical protein G3M78_03430 [Candidatus Nitrohelix vancouverensis]|uniref:Uncharacterized protein n=1 Tax=Candidatus Nitrohelix vancouverensis TaxID=2705534 RepID=A0A7T0C0W3_9BACT|nr:MAG: hypothetical protein G3M78_03430 [Candidatus Nitrohelix vancouverensis]